MRRLLFLICLGSACSSTEAGKGEIRVAWQRPDRQGEFVLSADATLCRETGVVELLAASGDTGVGIAIFPADSATVLPGAYPIFHGGNVLQEPRPGANLALRWFDRLALEAYQALNGEVLIDAGNTVLSGSFDAESEGIERNDSIRVSGRFRGVPLRELAVGCGVTSKRNRT